MIAAIERGDGPWLLDTFNRARIARRTLDK
jgi:hypothetical protein